MKTLSSGICTKENYSLSRGAICPSCQQIPIDKEKCFYLSPFEQIFIGIADAPFGAENKEVAVIFECQKCFKKYWFHWTKNAAEDLLYTQCKGAKKREK